MVSQLWHHWHFGFGNSLLKACCLMHCRMFSSIPILHLLNSGSNPPVVTMKSISRHWPMTSRRQNHPCFRSTDLASRNRHLFTLAAGISSCRFLPGISTLADPVAGHDSGDSRTSWPVPVLRSLGQLTGSLSCTQRPQPQLSSAPPWRSEFSTTNHPWAFSS